MKKISIISCALPASVVMLFLYCGTPQNPFTNPKSAGIVADSSLTSLKDSVTAFSTVPCTVSVYLPDLIDSFFVARSIGSQTGTTIASGKVTSAKIVFSLPVEYPGEYSITVRIVKTDKTTDSLTRTIIVDSPYSAQVGFVLPQKDSLLYHREYACSCSVSHSEFAESLTVRLIYSNTDSVLLKTRAAPGISFRVVVPVIGGFSLRVVAKLLAGGADSAAKECFGYVQVPVVAPDSVAFHVTLPLDSFTFNFTVTGPDSNLRFGYTWLDTATGLTQTTPFLSLKPFHETISRTVKKLALHAALNAPLICHAYAIDADSLFSAVASCTLYVTDTTKPAIRLLVPDTNVAISALPVLVRAIVTDLAGVNTVTFNGSSMAMAGDTASYTASSIDSGKSADSIVATDNAGNKAALLFRLTYSGKKLYPPKIKELSRATTEGHPFDTLWLDTCLTLTDTSIANPVIYKRDSLDWAVTDSFGAHPAILPAHRFVIPFPADTEWAGTIKLTFTVSVKNSPTLFDTRQPSFFVAEVYDPPVITYPQYLCRTVPYSDTIYLDTITSVRAIDNKFSDLGWTFKNGKHFKVDSLYSTRILGLGKKTAGQIDPVQPVIINPIIGFFNRHIRISNLAVADTGYYGTDTLQFTVTPPAGSAVVKSVYFSHSKICIHLQ